MVLWDLFGREAEMIYNTWNTSIRKIFRLDQRFHRYFIEPISKIKHIKIAFMKRFIKFTEQLACSTKRITRNVFHIIKHDCRSITGHNLWKIMQYSGNSRISEVTSFEVGKMLYHLIPNNEFGKLILLRNFSILYLIFLTLMIGAIFCTNFADNYCIASCR